MPQGASAPRGAAQVLHNAWIGGGSGCEVWIKTDKELQTSLNVFGDTFLEGCKDAVLQLDLSFPKV